jgi:hypothetical protein
MCRGEARTMMLSSRRSIPSRRGRRGRRWATTPERAIGDRSVERACLAFPILPGCGDLARAFLGEVATARSADFRQAGYRLGLTRADWFLVDGAGGEQVVVYLEGRDIAAALDLLSLSRDPFDRWFKDRLAETTGLDLNDPPEGMRPPELLASYESSDPR